MSEYTALPKCFDCGSDTPGERGWVTIPQSELPYDERGLAVVRKRLCSNSFHNENKKSNYVDIVFDGPPAPESGRFVEVENSSGASIKFGDWVEREDGYWVLRIKTTMFQEQVEALLKAIERLILDPEEPLIDLFAIPAVVNALYNIKEVTHE